PVPEIGWRERHSQPNVASKPLALFVEKDEHALAPVTGRSGGSMRVDELAHPVVCEQVVAHVLDRAELIVWVAAPNEYARMPAVKRVEVVDVAEAPNPAVDPEQIERRRRDEVDRRLVGAKEPAKLRDPAQRRHLLDHALLPPSRHCTLVLDRRVDKGIVD